MIFLATPSRNRSFFALKKPKNCIYFSKNAGNILTPNFLPRHFLSNVLYFFPFFFFFFFIFFFFFFFLCLFFLSSSSSYVCFSLPLLILFILILFLLLLSPSDSRSLLPGSLDSVAHFQLPSPAQSSIVFRVICIDLRRYWVL